MKTFVRVSALACGLILAGSTFAQDKAAPAPASPAAPAAKQQAPHDPTWVRMDLATLNNAAKPTPEQMGKFKDLDAKYDKLRRELPASLTAEQRANEVKTLMMKRDAEMRAILTPEQGKQYDEALRARHTAAPAPTPAPEKKK